MKKVNLILGALALTAVVVSCTKEEILETKPATQEIEGNNIKLADGWGIHRTVITDLNYIGEIFCTPPAEDCFDDVVIKVVKLEMLMKYCSEDNSAEYFIKEDWKSVFRYIPEEHLKNLINGDEKIIVKNQVFGGKIIEKSFIALVVPKDYSEKNTKIYLGYPLILE